MKRGFSLVEVSIVLVVLGLLTGGILAGKSLIRASELRSITTKLHQYAVAVQTFRGKYFQPPGDITNATSFWGRDDAVCAGDSGVTSSPGTCNGNGDWIINSASGANTTGEMFRFWQHLALSGLIEGSYSGVSGSSGGQHSLIDVNVPASKISNIGFSTQYRSGATAVL